MAALKRSCLIFLFMIVMTAPVCAADGFSVWIQDMQQEAIAEGIRPETAALLSQATLDDRVLELDTKQPESTITFDTYVDRIVSPVRIKRGQELMREHAAVLREVSRRTGVEPSVIVALWGIESNFGRNGGDYNVVDSLATLAYEGRRAAFFRKELLNALRIIDRGQIAASSMYGSWAGAMGQCQFMPSTYLRHAVSYDGGNSPDIWDNSSDVFASIANYIVAEGWRGDLTWGREVRVKKTIPPGAIGLDSRRSLAEWGRMGVRSTHGGALPNKPLQASLIAPDGPGGRYFLVYDNFRALMRWNRSTYFATSVGLLSDALKVAH
ncbi:MAG: lytic murein transglycosylase [Alphaproteobacteria bacterium]|nr:lytic murein transglycosylase [Alphaproteobacteria bacterium]